MRKPILTIALAFAFAIPFADYANAYGERWYMVKQASSMTANPSDSNQIPFCTLFRGDRVERLNSERIRGWGAHMYVHTRKIGGPAWCTGWTALSTLYNMDTVVENLDSYSNLGDTVPVWQYSTDTWASRDKARAAPPLPRRIQHIVKYDHTLVRDGPGTECIVSRGTEVRLERRHETFGQVFADITVLEGPHTGCYGYVRDSRLEEIESHARWDHNARKVCDIPVGTKVHVFEDQFSGAARIRVIDGPCRNREGWILSYTLTR